MSGFSGFSDAYIQKIQNNNEPVREHFNGGQQQSPKQPKAKPTVVRENKNLKILQNKINLNDKKSDIPLNAKLCPENEIENTSMVSCNLKDDKDKLNDKEEPNNKNINNLPDLNTLSEKKTINLDDFQLRQKRMEEQNRLRKQLLEKALEDRTKRTLEEQQRLSEIQREFKKLDENLSNDVKILRKQIEMASLDYMEAQKKHFRAEREYLETKMLLHQRLEKKEMLTEYLCAIIEKNEERKADKLNELLQKLDFKDIPSINQDCQDENSLVPD